MIGERFSGELFMGCLLKLEFKNSGFVEAADHAGGGGEAFCVPAAIHADRDQMKFLFGGLDIDDHPAIERDAVCLAAHRRFDECFARAADAPVESDGGSWVAPLNRALDLDAWHGSGHLNGARLDCRGERTL